MYESTSFFKPGTAFVLREEKMDGECQGRI